MIGLLVQLISSYPFWGILVLLLVLCLTYDYRQRCGLPPGPYGLPFIGYIPFFDPNRMSQQLAALCKEYRTDILSVTGPTVPLIVLNTYDLMKEVFQKRTDLTDRHAFSFFQAFDPDFSGVITTSGKKWRESRRFSISMLRDFGMGRIGAEERIQNESRILADLIKTYNGKAFDPKDHINVAVSNIICGMVFGQRYDHDDPEFTQALNGMNDMTSRIKNFIVVLALRSKFGRYLYRETFQHCSNDYGKFSSFVKRRIAEHRETYDGEVTDMIYGYLKEMKQDRDPDVFDDKMLESLIIDYFFAGSETTYSTLRWGLLAMAAHPEIQRKVQKELDQVVGERSPSMSDKKLTPYSDAVLCEIQRHYTLVPLGLAHGNVSEDVTINGYRIPRNSLVRPNIRQIHHDPNTWKNPEEFDPENFLEDGKVANLERLVPFSIGRRACAGEALARMELYVFFISLVKEFEILLESDDAVADMSGVGSGLYIPKPFKIRMKARY